MRAGWLGQGLGIVTGAMLALTAMHDDAHAARYKSARSGHYPVASHGSANRATAYTGRRSWRPSWQRNALQCVPFARENTGIEISGNAGTWWNTASGLYERGARPEVGSILNFRATGHMRMGHVAVVTNVITSRHIEIDHANWGAPGRISRNIDVVDVSPGNDWTAVRVALDQTENYGSVYPTFGFIYDRPDRGIMLANATPMAAPALNAIAAPVAAPVEVAEAADDGDLPAPRYSARHHASRAGKATALASRQRGYSPFPTASTFRVSTRPGAPGKALPHKPARKRT